MEGVFKWVPCKERLPETNGRYLTTNDIEEGLEVRIITFYNGDWYRVFEGYEDVDGLIKTRPIHLNTLPVNVTAWYKIPEPYKGV